VSAWKTEIVIVTYSENMVNLDKWFLLLLWFCYLSASEQADKHTDRQTDRHTHWS